MDIMQEVVNIVSSQLSVNVKANTITKNNDILCNGIKILSGDLSPR